MTLVFRDGCVGCGFAALTSLAGSWFKEFEALIAAFKAGNRSKCALPGRNDVFSVCVLFLYLLLALVERSP